MSTELRVTTRVARVLRAFLDDQGGHVYGYALMHTLNMHSGLLYPILGRLEAAGWIEGQREDIDAVAEGRPPRRYYRLTALGEQRARAELAAAGDPS